MSLVDQATLGLSLVALLLGVWNFVVERRDKKAASRRQERDDRVRVDNLLDAVWDHLYGDGGYIHTNDISKYLAAESAVRRAATILPNYSRVEEYLGNVCRVKGNDTGAKSHYERALTLQPLRGGTYCALANLAEGNTALHLFYEAIRIDPQGAGNYYYDLGRFHQRAEQWNDAVTAYQKSIAYSNKNDKIWYHLGYCYKQTGRVHDARISYEKAISINPTNVSALVNLGTTLMDTGDWEDGLRWIDHARKTDPLDAYPLRMLAAVYMDRGEEKKAAQYIAQVQDIDATTRLQDDLMYEMREAIKVNGASTTEA